MEQGKIVNITNRAKIQYKKTKIREKITFNSSIKQRNKTDKQMASAAPENNKIKAGLKAGLKLAKLGGIAGLGAVKLGLSLGGLPGGEMCDTISNTIDQADEINKDTGVVGKLQIYNFKT